MSASDAVPAAPPAGWYPDPAGSAQWRRWDGATWGDATMPYGPPPPESAWLLREQLTWGFLRTVAPIGLAAPGVAAVTLAAESPEYGPVRRWVRLFFNAYLHGRAVPAMPTVRATSAEVVATFLVWIAIIVGLLAWSRFAAASIRVAVQAGYPQRHSALWSSLSLLLPLVGPVVASSASRASLPAGHEARRVLAVGWSLVLAGQLAILGVYASVWSTPSLVVCWSVAAVCAAAWVLAAIELPMGLGAIAEDHETLRVRLGTPPS